MHTRHALFSALVAACGASVFVGALNPYAVAAADSEEAAVQVREAPLREKPSALARVIGRLPYGANVLLLESRSGSWAKVQHVDSEISGWLRLSAVRPGGFQTKPASGAAPLAATAEEIAYAAKGMQEIEGEFQDAHPALNEAFAALDAIEASALYNVPPEEVARFLSEGELAPEGDL